jgi:Septum formation
MSDYPPPPPPPSPYQPGPVAQQASRNGLGIAAVILGIIGVLSGFIPLFIPLFFWVAGIFGIIGLMLGLVGYGRFQRGAATNGTMALWGIITSAVAVVLSIVGLVILLIGVFADLSEDPAVENESTVPSAAETSAPAQEEETAPTEPEQVDVFGLEVGDCLAEPQDAEEVFSIETLPCSEPHSEEVFAAVTIPEGDGEFPGFRAIDAQAEELCIAEFEDFVGRSYQQSVLDFWFITPSEETWGDGDREVLCTVYDPAGDTTGTLADSNR